MSDDEIHTQKHKELFSNEREVREEVLYKIISNGNNKIEYQVLGYQGGSGVAATLKIFKSFKTVVEMQYSTSILYILIFQSMSTER
jgi:hypothetical protein